MRKCVSLGTEEEMADDKSFEEAEKKSSTDTNASAPVKEKRKGIFSRIWNGLFRFHRDDLEKRLQYISKEEAAVLARMKSRSQSWRQMSRNLIIFSVTLEVLTVLLIYHSNLNLLLFFS